MAIKKTIRNSLYAVSLAGSLSGFCMAYYAMTMNFRQTEPIPEGLETKIDRMREIGCEFDKVRPGMPYLYNRVYNPGDSRFIFTRESRDSFTTVGDILLEPETETKYKKLLEEYNALRLTPSVVDTRNKYDALANEGRNNQKKLFFGGLAVIFLSIMSGMVASKEKKES
mgnify:FL=1